MSMYVYSSTASSIEAGRQRMKRLITPLLEQIYNRYDSNAPKEVTINNNNELLINGTSVGDWRFMSCFEADDIFLSFKYGNKERLVMFGTNPFDLSTCYIVATIMEYTPGTNRKEIIYEWEDSQ